MFLLKQTSEEVVHVYPIPPDGIAYDANLRYAFSHFLTYWEWDTQQQAYRVRLWDVWVIKNALERLNMGHMIRVDDRLLGTFQRLESHKSVEKIDWLSFKRDPRLHQWQDIWFGLNRRSCIVGHDRGVGKTLSGIGIGYAKCIQGTADHVLCVVPSTLLTKWQREIERFVPEPFNTSVIIQGELKERRELWNAPAWFHIVSSGIAYNDRELWKANWLWKKNFLVTDEHHRYRNRYRYQKGKRGRQRVKRTEVVETLANKSVGMVALTGHDVHKLENWFEMFAPINKNLFGSHREFGDQFLLYGTIPGKIVGYKNEDIFSLKMQPLFIRKTKAEVIADLPEKSYEERIIDLSDSERRYYRALRNGEVNLKDNERANKLNFTNVMVRIGYLQRFLDCPALVSSEWPKVSSKMKELKAILEEAGGSEKIVIFTRWAKMVHRLHNFIGEDKSLILVGGMNAQEKGNEFMRRDDIRYLIMDTAGGEGIDLHGYEDDDGVWHTGADTLIFVDEHDDSGINGQVEDRIHRDMPEEYRKKWHASIIWLRVKNSVDMKLAKRIKENVDFARRLVSGAMITEAEFREIS